MRFLINHVIILNIINRDCKKKKKERKTKMRSPVGKELNANEKVFMLNEKEIPVRNIA